MKKNTGIYPAPGRRIILSFLGGLFYLLFLGPGCRTQQEITAQLTDSATFIFRGKVIALHTSNLETEQVFDYGVVRLTELIDEPAGINASSGQQVTIRFKDISRISIGESRLFFTLPVSFGETLGVREIISYDSRNKLFTDSSLLSQIQESRRSSRIRQLHRLLDSSGLVISGKVIQIDSIKYTPHGISSEHDPLWKAATVLIDEVFKGTHDQKTVIINFPSSNDIMFADFPKLSIGATGIFIIQTPGANLSKLLRNDKLVYAPDHFVQNPETISEIQSLLK
jgi:hypothetical protein